MKLVRLRFSAFRVVARTLGSMALATALFLAAIPGQVSPVLAAETPPDHLHTWGGYGAANGQFQAPHGVAVDAQGNVYVAEYGNSRIQKFSSTGAYLTQWTGGENPGDFSGTYDVALDGAGNIYVADSSNNRIQVLDKTGAFLTKWGSPGQSNGQFDSPRGIAIDSLTRVYIADFWNHRVQRFVYDSGSGTWIHDATWGGPGEGSGMGQFNNPWGIAVDEDDNVYVADTNNHRIQKLDASTWMWSVLAGTGSDSDAAGAFSHPHDVSVGADGAVYVTDYGNHRVQKFDSSGGFIDQWGEEGDQNGEFEYPAGIVVSSDGTIYVSEWTNHRVQMFAYLETPPVFITAFGTEGSENGEFNQPRGVAVDPDGRVYVSDTMNNRIQRFTWNASTGEYEHDETWGGPAYGSEPGQFHSPQGIASNSQGHIYVVEAGLNRRIQKFDPDATENPWTVIADTTKPFITNPPPGQFFNPNGLTVAADGTIYTSDTTSDTDRIQAFTYNADTGEYEYSHHWGEHGTGDGQFDRPYGIGVDSHGYVYAADYGCHRTQKFDADGNFITKWGSQGTGDGQLNSPTGVAVDSQGYVYVSERQNHRIQKFTANGVYRTKWGGQGAGEGQFSGPWHLAVGQDGRIYVADNLNHRIQVFSYPVAIDFDIPLVAGWNMVSVPLELYDASRGAVFPPSEVVAVYTWNPGSKSYEVPDDVLPEVGYWVAVTEDKTLTVTGTPKTTWTDDLTTGWNMIGSVSETRSVDHLVPDEGDPLLTNAIYWWDPEAKAYTGATQIEPGLGYWLASTDDCTVTLGPPEPA